MGNNSGSCRDCEKPYTTVKPRECPGCKGLVCNYCIENPVLLEGDTQTFKITLLCLKCLREKAALDFSQSYEILGPDNAHTLIWLHGGGSCRKMFYPHAQFMVDNGFRCILLDLPGHGAEVDQALTTKACIEAVYKIRKQHCSEAPILVGGSLGGYIAMEVIGRYPSTEDFKAAVVMMCGQNVGEGRAWKASLGLWGMGKAIKFISSEKLVNGLVKAATNVEKPVLAELLRSGYYFRQGDRQIEILKTTNPAHNLAKYQGRVLFINGSKDHRDSEIRWKQAGKATELLVYQNADHFFSHDKRFMSRLNEDISKFTREVFGSRAKEESANEQSVLQ